MVSSADPTQLTAQLRAQLRDYIGFTGAINSTLKSINQIQAELEDDKKPIAAIKVRLDKGYDTIEEQANDEMRRLDLAISTLDALMAVQTPMALENTTISGNASKRATQNTKKRKIDTASTASSPAPSAMASPLPSYDGAALHAAPLSRTTSSKQGQLPPLQNAHSGSGQALQQIGIPKKSTIKSRKENLQAQLPLKPGRMICVRQSKKDAPGDWILGRIISCIQGDKNRYGVEDVDYDPANPTPEGGKWNTTLKSIIPLPDKLDERTYPEHPYPGGTSVLALYPETTSFYAATIEGGPYAVSTGTGKNKIKERIYKIKFEDDNDEVRDVLMEFVVEAT
ncbi:Sgf29p [Sporobolomyces koalae]|uniref:Sgf29p n=1 Tax=Sporobolomyces koalae TaxID=500713 RepID=UPI00316D58E4